MVEVQAKVIDLGEVAAVDVHVLYILRLSNNLDKSVRIKLETIGLGGALSFQTENENLGPLSSFPDHSRTQNHCHSHIYDEICTLNEVLLEPHETGLPIVLCFSPVRFLKDHPTFNRHVAIDGSLLLRSVSDGPEDEKEDGSEVEIDVIGRLSQTEFSHAPQELDFGSCSVGSTLVRDFTLINRSAFPIPYRLYAHIELASNKKRASVSNKLLFFDCDTGEPAETGSVAPFSTKPIRSTFQALSLGPFRCFVQILNLLSDGSPSDNRIEMHATVSAAPVAEIVEITNGRDSLDFGACYTLLRTSRTLTLRNLTSQHVRVSLSSNLGPQEITFFSDEPKIDPSQSKDSELESLIAPSPSLEAIKGPLVHRLSSLDSSAKAEDVDSGNEKKIGGESPTETTGRRERAHVKQITLTPNSQQTLNVIYVPSFDENLPVLKAQRLQLRTFKLLFGCSLVDVGHEGGEDSVITDLMDKNDDQHLSNTLQLIQRCTAQVCTSYIGLLNKMVNLGDCNIDNIKKSVVQVVNMSDLPTEVEVHYNTKILRFRQVRFSLLARQSLNIQFDFIPGKVNPDYRKEVTFVNLKNPTDEQYLTIRANNIDRNGITLHNHYYQLLLSNFRHYINMHSVIYNSPKLRKFVIKSVNENAFRLQLSTSRPSEMRLFVVDIPSSVPQPSTSTSPVKQSKVPSLNLAQLNPSLLSSTKGDPSAPSFDAKESSLIAKYLDLAAHSSSNTNNSSTLSSSSLGQTSSNASSANASTRSFPSISDTLGLEDSPILMGRDGAYMDLEMGSLSLPQSALTPKSTEKPRKTRDLQHYVTKANRLTELFDDKSNNLFGPADEISLVKLTMTRMQLLNEALDEEKGFLKPIEELRMSPKSEQTVYVVYIPKERYPSSEVNMRQGKLHHVEAKIFFKLFETEDPSPSIRSVIESANQNPSSATSIPIRELLISAKLCKPVMGLAQKNINFGNLTINQIKTNTLHLNNHSELPLLYKVKKSRNIASQDVFIPHKERKGCILPFSSRDINLTFKPKFPGSFREQIIIESIHDPSSCLVVSLKAEIEKPKHLYTSSDFLDFGISTFDKPLQLQQHFSVTNTSNRPRDYVIALMPPVSAIPSITDETTTTVDCSARVLFSLSSSSALPDPQAEGLLEDLKHKIAIAIRKKNEEKIADLQQQIDNLVSHHQNANHVPLLSEGSDPIQSLSSVKASSKKKKKGSNNNGEKKEGNETIQTVNSLTFSVDGGASQTILLWVEFPSSSNRHLSPRICTSFDITGEIHIYEAKNRDDITTIRFSSQLDLSSVTPDPLETSSSEIATLLRASSPSSFKPSRIQTPSPPLLPVLDSVSTSSSSSSPPSVDRSFFAGRKASITDSFSGSPPATSLMGRLVVSPAEINLNRLQIGSKIFFSIQLRNTSLTHRIKYAVENVDGKTILLKNAKEQTGEISPNTALEITMFCHPFLFGKQTHQFSVRNLSPPGGSGMFIGSSSDGYNVQHVNVHFISYQTGLFIIKQLVNESLNLGICFLDNHLAAPKSSSVQSPRGKAISLPSKCLVVPFDLCSITFEKITVESISSNMKKQVTVFQDEACTTIVNNCIIEPSKQTRFFIRLEPNFSNLKPQGIWDDLYREVVGGLQMRIIKAEVGLIERTIRFTATIGRSVLHIPETRLDAGVFYSVEKAQYKGFLIVSNLSTHLPLNYSVVKSDCITKQSAMITLQSSRGQVPPATSQKVPAVEKIFFEIKALQTGFHVCRVIIKNNDCGDQVCEALIRMFVDSKKLFVRKDAINWRNATQPSTGLVPNFDMGIQFVRSTRSSSPSHAPEGTPLHFSESSSSSSSDQPDSSPSSSFHVVPDHPEGEKGTFFEFVSVDEAEDSTSRFQMHNTTSNSQTIAVYAEPHTPIFIKWHPSEDQHTTSFENSAPEAFSSLDIFNDLNGLPLDHHGLTYVNRSALIRLPAFGSVAGELMCSGPLKIGSSSVSSSISGSISSMREALLKGEPHPFCYALLFCNVQEKRVVKVLDAVGSVGLSILSIEPSAEGPVLNKTNGVWEFKLGRVGVDNDWNDVPVEFGIRNNSKIMTTFKIEVVGKSHDVSEKSLCFSREIQSISPALVVQEILKLTTMSLYQERTGTQKVNLIIHNCHNPNNQLHLSIEWYLVANRLQFHRLSGPKQRLLLQEPLLLPAPHEDVLVSDEWFSIENVSDSQQLVDVQMIVDPKLSMILTIELVHRFDNSSVSAAHLDVGERMKLKVRAKVNPLDFRDRLPSADTLSLLDFPVFPCETGVSLDSLRTLGRLVVSCSSSPDSPLQQKDRDHDQDEEESGDEEQGKREEVTSEIEITGYLYRSMTFSLSTTHLDFFYVNQLAIQNITNVTQLLAFEATTESQQQTFEIHNIFWEKIDLEMLIDDAAFGFVVDPKICSLDPQSSVIVKVLLPSPDLNRDLLNNSCSTLWVKDIRHQVQQSVGLMMIAQSKSWSSTTSASSLSTTVSSSSPSSPFVSAPASTATSPVKRPKKKKERRSDPIINLRGCQPAQFQGEAGSRASGTEVDCYELDLGKIRMPSSPFTFALKFEVDFGSEEAEEKEKTIPFKINPVTVTQEEDWLSIQPQEGEITRSHPRATVVLSMQPTQVGLHHRHFGVSNEANPRDYKLVRVSLTVVDGPSEAHKYFQVFSDGQRLISDPSSRPKTPIALIDMGEVYVDRNYSDRSITIRNCSARSLEFVLRSDLSSLNDLTELHFSYSRTTLKRVTSLVMDPQSDLQLHLHLIPRLAEGEKEKIEETKSIQVHISCSAVQDFVCAIEVRAKFRRPQMRLSGSTFRFVGSGIPTSSDDRLGFGCSSLTLSLSNGSPRIPLQYAVMNISQFFTIETPSSQTIEGVEGKDQTETHELVIRPNLKAIAAHQQLIQEERYIEEHVPIYNRLQMGEKYDLRLCLSVGFVRDFHSTPTRRNAHTYLTLERLISQFIREIRIRWSSDPLSSSLHDSPLVVRPSGGEKVVGQENEEVLGETQWAIENWSAANEAVEGFFLDSQLFFTFTFLVDECLFYALKKQIGKNSFHLAEILFFSTFQQQMFEVVKAMTRLQSSRSLPPSLSSDRRWTEALRWVQKLPFFLKYFPSDGYNVKNLKLLEESLRSAGLLVSLASDLDPPLPSSSSSSSSSV